MVAGIRFEATSGVQGNGFVGTRMLSSLATHFATQFEDTGRDRAVVVHSTRFGKNQTKSVGAGLETTARDDLQRTAKLVLNSGRGLHEYYQRLASII